MKRLLGIIIAAAVCMSISISAFAAEATIMVKNNVSGSKAVTYTYDTESKDKESAKITALMTKLSGLTNTNSVVQPITVTSNTEKGNEVDVTLRLTMPSGKDDETVDSSVLDYYNITVTTADGSVVYDYETADSTEDGSTYKDIPLGTLNTEKASESRLFNITVSANKDITKNSVIKQAKNLDWLIVTKSHAEEAKETDAPAGETMQPAATQTAAPVTPAPTSSVKSDKNGVYKLTGGDYTVGKDVDAGRYTMTGEGKVHVYDENDTLKTTIALKDAKDKSASGVSEYVINLKNGDRINIENTAELEPYTAPSATPKATSTPKPSTSSSSTAKATTAPSSKTNPKTGDNAPIIGVSAVGILALAGAILLFIKKRKNN